MKSTLWVYVNMRSMGGYYGRTRRKRIDRKGPAGNLEVLRPGVRGQK